MRRSNLFFISLLALLGCRDVLDPTLTSGPQFAMGAPPLPPPPPPPPPGGGGSGAWASIASLPERTSWAAGATAADGRVFLFGGNHESCEAAASGDPGGLLACAGQSYVYDQAFNVWTSAPDMPALQGRSRHAAARGSDGRLYVFGGSGLDALSSVLAFDPTTNSWSSAASLPVGLTELGAATGPGGRIYVTGGVDASGVVQSKTRVYDPLTDTWSDLADLPEGRHDFGMVGGADRRVYVVGGRNGKTELSSAYVYDPSTDRWSPIASLPGARAGIRAVLGADNVVYAIGGEDQPGAHNDVFKYDAAGNAWQPADAMMESRARHGVATSADGRLLALGGADKKTGLSGAEALATIPAPPPPPGPPPNLDPVADAGADQVAECVTGCADVTLDGSGSSDPENGPLTYEWLENGQVLATGVSPTVHLALGVHAFTLRVTDDKGATDESSVGVTVQDTQAPAIGFSQLADALRPRDHRLELVVVGIAATDACDDAPVVSVAVTSDEPEDRNRDGHTESDWQVIQNDDGTQSVRVRAERRGRGDGRLYTIAITATDRSGNSATAQAVVAVPHERGERDDDDHDNKAKKDDDHDKKGKKDDGKGGGEDDDHDKKGKNDDGKGKGKDDDHDKKQDDHGKH